METEGVFIYIPVKLNNSVTFLRNYVVQELVKARIVIQFKVPAGGGVEKDLDTEILFNYLVYD